MQFEEDSFVNEANSAPYNPMYAQELMDYEKHKHGIEHSKQNMHARKEHAEQIFIFTVVWCFALFMLLFGCGLGKLKLSDSVIIAIISSTTVNVFVFFKLVTEYLFNKDNPHS